MLSRKGFNICTPDGLYLQQSFLIRRALHYNITCKLLAWSSLLMLQHWFKLPMNNASNWDAELSGMAIWKVHV